VTYRTFEHTADLGLIVDAPGREGLFSEAGRALLSVLVDNPDAVRPEREVIIEVSGSEPDYLLFDWLNEILYRFEKERLLLSEFDVTFGSEGLKANARGEPLDPARHEPAHEIKAITYHQLEMRETDDGWRARFIVDI
jgi:SHS2 domain-containing protein